MHARTHKANVWDGTTLCTACYLKTKPSQNYVTLDAADATMFIPIIIHGHVTPHIAYVASTSDTQRTVANLFVSFFMV